jgi:serine/threonine protein kinase/WD40 repeat protein
MLKTLGEGGMGVVYLAEQTEPLQRQVAVKVIKIGMDTREVVGRFEAERQTLALMDHPNIARVYDAGATTDGRPYFVMEHVAGVSLTDYCDRHRLSTQDRLAVFVKVCTAVQHAHQKGVIHRDLKPSNVLVSDHDGTPVPKVIDFGIAKATEASFAERTLFTERGVMVGTPEYMSPEQAASSADIDTTTDVYSLGVILYELLVGALPFEPRTLRAAGYDEMRRMIRESDPPKPSTRLTGLGPGAGNVAVNRQTDARLLGRQLKGDLDWIVLKALEKDRLRRYPTVAAFAADVERYLGHEPVVARPPSHTYRLGKFARRHRVGVAAGLSVAAALVAGLVISLLATSRANEARRSAERDAYEATIRVADLSLREGTTGPAASQLAKAAIGSRDLEWRMLWQAVDSSIMTLLPDPATIRGNTGWGLFQFSNSGGDVILAAGSVYAWSLPAGTKSNTPRTRINHDTTLAVSIGGSLVAGVGKDRGVEIIRTADGQQVGTLSGTDGRIDCAGFSNDGQRIASLSPKGLIEVWTIDGQRVAGFRGIPPAPRDRFSAMPACAIEFSADDRLLVVSASHAGTFDARYGHPLSSFDHARLARLSRDTRTLALINVDGSIETRKGAGFVDQGVKWNADGPSDLAISPDGRLVAEAQGGRVRVWDAGSGLLLDSMLFDSILDDVSALAFAPRDHYLFAAHRFHEVTVFHTDRLYRMSDLLAATTTPTAVTISDDEKLLAVGDEKGSIAVWSLPDIVPVATLTGSKATISVAIDGRARLVAANEDNAVRVWDVRTGALVRTLRGHKGVLARVAVSHDSRTIASASADGVVNLWNAETGELSQTFTCDKPLKLVAFDASDSNVIAAGGGVSVEEGSTGNLLAVCRWNVTRTTLASRLVLTKDLYFGNGLDLDVTGGEPLAILPNGLGVLAAHRRDAALWNVADGSAFGSVLTVLRGHALDAFSGAVTPTRLVTMSLDGTMRIWSAETGGLLLTQPIGRPAGFQAVAVSQSGRYMAAVVHPNNPGAGEVLGAGRGVIRFWDLSADRDPGTAPLVAALFRSEHMLSRVEIRLASDALLTSAVRTEAIAMARRRGDDAGFLRRQAWTAAQITKLPSGGAAQEAYRRGLEEIDRSLQLEPDNAQALRARALLFYRLGRLDEAASAIATAVSKWPTPAIADLAITALVAAGLNRPNEARTALDAARTLAAGTKSVDSVDAALLAEATTAVSRHP